MDDKKPTSTWTADNGAIFNTFGDAPIIVNKTQTIIKRGVPWTPPQKKKKLDLNK